jgi:ubiquinone/menaquinone biosynthesis C-methylase UbiE
VSWLGIALGALAVAGLGVVAYWQLIIAEGTYLGPRFVAKTYDWVARRYDGIKQFRPRDESWFVAAPLQRALAGVERPLVLDVATGTGRMPLALLRDRFEGQIVGLDLSLGMLHQARAKLQTFDRVSLVWQDASLLPFAADAFDAVTCLESLEFLPRPQAGLAEMVRVLAPGGVLFLTNRVGSEARLLPGRAIPRPRFEGVLEDLGLEEVRVRPWQVNYDLAIARRPGVPRPAGRGGSDLAALLRCPNCGIGLGRKPAALGCLACGRIYGIHQGVVHLAKAEKRGKP